MKPRLLVLELWALGDLAVATPFLQAVSRVFDVTLLARPVAEALRPRFWPEVRVVPFLAPFTAYHHKYRLHRWPWVDLTRKVGLLRNFKFEVGVSSRWNPFENLLLLLSGCNRRIGFPRAGTGILLTQRLSRISARAHRYDDWKIVAGALGIEMPESAVFVSTDRRHGHVVMHTGAGQKVRVWPLDRFREIVRRLRALGFTVTVACDVGQSEWWRQTGEQPETPADVDTLLKLFDGAAAFVGNDSGPGHWAAICGVPTFTIFGPQLPEWFVPLHPAAEWVPGRDCPFKQCFDRCRFEVPHCLYDLHLEEVWKRVEAFIRRRVIPVPAAGEHLTCGSGTSNR